MNRTAQHPLLHASAVLVHCFARVKWTQIQGQKWKSAGGRVLSDASYQKLQGRLKDAPAKKAAKAKAPPDPSENPNTANDAYAKSLADRLNAMKAGPKAGAQPAPKPTEAPGERKAALPKPGSPEWAALPNGYSPGPGAQGRLFGAQYATAKPASVPGLAKPLPMPSPAESAYINENHAKDTKRFGPKVANFLRVGLASAVGILTATNGLAWGAILGTALGGPLGLALGTAIGGGLGGRLGAWAGKKTDRALGGAGRAAVEVRKAARTVLPSAAALGAASGAAKGTRRLLARSPAAKRKAARVNDQKLFSELERFTDPVGRTERPAPPSLDPVALLKARIAAILARQGKPAIQIDDEPIIAALALAAQEEDAEESDQALAAMAEACGAQRKTRKKVRKFAGRKRGSGLAPFVPNLSNQRGAGLVPGF